MTSNLPDLSRATLNQIIFEGRNQEYGAYELRVIYPQHLKRAVAVMLGLCAVLALGSLVRDYVRPAEVASPVTKPIEEILHILQDKPVLEQVVPVQPVAQTPPVLRATTRFVPPKVVTDRTPVTEPALTTMAIANEADNLGAHALEGIEGAAPITETPVTAPGPAKTDEIMTFTEQMPEYPGGLLALQRYLGTHIKYPAVALRNGVEGKVYVRFVVDETGRVVNPVIIRGIGYGCDEEALRVLLTMPLFKPGAQNGRPVKVYFNLPIAFKAL